ncbi:hypothetical protein DBB_38370 [Desulfoluna spongiiphila]|nr:hypothetical protein DBB_38370 [Desulfoluna spongiiphila]
MKRPQIKEIAILTGALLIHGLLLVSLLTNV